jgi:hypothetical protein
MTELTRSQRETLARIYRRGPDWFGPDYPPTYRHFRKQVQPQLCGDGAVMVKAGNLWIGIEPDGYAHT